MRRLLWGLMASLALAGATFAVSANSAGAQQDAGPDSTDDPISAVVLAYFRFGGADRYATSLAVAEEYAALHDGKLDHVVLVSGERWTDAVVAAPLTGLHGAPVLMIPPGELRRDAVDFLRDASVTKAIVVGSASSDAKHGPGRGLSDTVLSGLAKLEIDVERVHGADRFGTAVAVAERLVPGDMPGLGSGSTVIVASGDVFADALVAGPFAALGVHPVLLTTPGELHPDVADYLRGARVRDNVRHVVVMGGTAALAQPVQDAIVDADMKVTRLAGATRYDTAILAAELVEDRYEGLGDTSCFSSTSYGVARAHVPFDAFSAAPLLARLCTSLLLSDPDAVPVPTAEYLDLKMLRVTQETDADFYLTLLYVFGGDAAVSQDSLDTYLAEATQRIAEGRAGQIDTEPDDADSAGITPTVLPAGTCGDINDPPRQLVPSHQAYYPAWSPDCSQIAYTQDRALWIASRDGSRRRQLVPFDESEPDSFIGQADWSPDGSRIVYTSRRYDYDLDRQYSSLWTVRPDGSDRRQLTDGDGGKWADYSPNWSPDGTKIAFSRLVNTPNSSDEFIVTINSDGQNETVLNYRSDHQSFPVWSPDGTQIAYLQVRYENPEVIEAVYVADADGGNPQRVIDRVHWREGLSWSPDGKCIAYVEGTEGDASIYVANIKWNIVERVTFLEGEALWPRWSPDGQVLAFHHFDADGRARVYVTGLQTAPDTAGSGCGYTGPAS